MSDGIEFEWDDSNVKHLQGHDVTPNEFEQIIRGDPVDVDFENVEGEERWKSVGFTDSGRMLVAVWTIRHFKIRAITAFNATGSYRRSYWEGRK